MKSHRTALTLLLLAAWLPARAELNQLQNLNQQEFRALSEDLGAAASYKALAPAAPLGVTGFDVGVAVTGTRVKHRDLWERASSSGDFPSTAPVPSLRAAKGLPWDFDIAIAYSPLPKTGASLWGGALSWAVLAGDAARPAIGVRASYTTLRGLDQLNFYTTALDASISKGFGPITPYVGAGKVWVNSQPTSGVPLAKESFGQTKLFGGAALGAGPVNFVLEYDRTGGVNTYGAKLGLKF